MDKQRIADSGPVLFVVMLLSLYVIMKLDLYSQYYFYIYIALLVLEAVSIMFSNYGTLVSSIPYILLLVWRERIGYIASLPFNYILLMLVVSVLIIPSRIFLKRGNLSSYISFSTIILLYYFLNFSIFSHYTYYLIFLSILFLLAYFLSTKSDTFVSYLVSFFLIVSLIALPLGYIDGVLNTNFYSMLKISLIVILPISLIVFLQDTLYDKTIPYTGIVVSIGLFIIIFFVRVEAIIFELLVIGIAFVVPFASRKLFYEHDADASFYGTVLLSLAVFLFLNKIVNLLSFLISFIVFYVTVKKIKKSNK